MQGGSRPVSIGNMRMRDQLARYREHVARLVGQHERGRGLELAVGGDFDFLGRLELALLVQEGLRPDGYLVDVGCGSGRLAAAVADYLYGRYLGTDIVPELLEHARGLVGERPGWRFELVDGPPAVPEHDGQADMVCFFSVFTHLLHEQSYAYLEEARRVLKPEVSWCSRSWNTKCRRTGRSLRLLWPILRGRSRSPCSSPGTRSRPGRPTSSLS